MPSLLVTFIAGDATIRQSFAAMLAMLIGWLILSFLLLEIGGRQLYVPYYVILVNLLLFGWGVLAIYGASITSHAISASFLHPLKKGLARFVNFLFLFAGIVVIILVTSGEVSWMTYLFYGVTSGLR